MKSILKLGDKVIVTRVISKNDKEKTYNGDYPRLGWTGILKKLFYSSDQTWTIKWDNTLNMDEGDFIKEWMIEKIEKDWDD